MSLRREVFQRIDEEVGPAFFNVPHHRSICSINGWRVNVRTAHDKQKNWYWFDVTPKFYELNLTDFFLFVCGYPTCLYLFPVDDFRQMIAGASLGGQKQVPNFSIFPATHEFEPAGQANRRWPIQQFFDDLAPLKRAPVKP